MSARHLPVRGVHIPEGWRDVPLARTTTAVLLVTEIMSQRNSLTLHRQYQDRFRYKGTVVAPNITTGEVRTTRNTDCIFRA